MNNQKLIIYEFEELYKILIEINNDVNLIIKKASKNDISDFISQPNTLILTQKKISSLENQIIFDGFPVPILKLLEKINTQFLKINFNKTSDIMIGSYKFNLNSREMSQANLKLKLTEKEINSIPKTSRDALTWEGDLVAVPWNPGPILMHYNRNLMKEAGLNPDSPPKTWAELKDAVMKICKLPDRNGGNVFGIALRTSQNPNSAQWSIPIVYGHGGDIQVDNKPEVNNKSVSCRRSAITPCCTNMIICC